MQTKQADTDILSPDILMEKLAVAAAEAFEIGAEENSTEFMTYMKAIDLISKAWHLPRESTNSALAKLDELLTVIRADGYRPEEDIFAEKSVLNAGPSECGLLILQKLQETADRLNNKHDKAQIAYVSSYIKDFWEAQA